MWRSDLTAYDLQMKYSNFVGGKWVPSQSSATFENRNPADTDDLIGLFPDSTTTDAEAAISSAKRAYETWRLVPAPKRAEILFKAAQLIAARKEEFARDMTREMGKVIDETRGLGVSGMRERALLVDGKLEVYSRPGRGTTVQLEVPV